MARNGDRLYGVVATLALLVAVVNAQGVDDTASVRDQSSERSEVLVDKHVPPAGVYITVEQQGTLKTVFTVCNSLFSLVDGRVVIGCVCFRNGICGCLGQVVNLLSFGSALVTVLLNVCTHRKRQFPARMTTYGLTVPIP